MDELYSTQEYDGIVKLVEDHYDASARTTSGNVAWAAYSLLQRFNSYMPRPQPGDDDAMLERRYKETLDEQALTSGIRFAEVALDYLMRAGTLERVDPDGQVPVYRRTDL